MSFAFAFAFVLTGAQAHAMSPPIQLDDESVVYSVSGNADILDDPGGNLDIDDVARSKQFRRVSEDDQPPLGAVRWYRFRAKAPDGSNPRWYVLSGRASVSLDLYEARADGGFSHVAFGYNVPFAARQAPGRDPATLVHRLQGPLFVRARAEKYPQYIFLATAASIGDGYLDGPGYPAGVAMLVLAIAVAGLGAITRSRSFWLLAAVGLSAAATFALPSELPMWLPHLSPPPVWMIVIATFSAYFIAQASFYYLSRARPTPKRVGELRVCRAYPPGVTG